MWQFGLLGLFLIVTARRDDYDRIGYFWQITDIHYDPLFPTTAHLDQKRGCLRHEDGSGSYTNKVHKPKYDDHHCDSSWDLIESAAKFMKSMQSDNVEFVLWTGDALSHFTTKHLSEKHQLELLQALTDLLGKTFPVQFVFPALGHDDPPFKKHLGRMWSRWLPTDSIRTFENGGYYIIERKLRKLQIVVLNTDLMKRHEHDEDASKQWKWLDKVLDKFEKNRETVFLVGHVAPGRDEKSKTHFAPTHKGYQPYHNERYLDLVRNHSKIIVGQFFGHLHSDSFRVIYDKDARPISWAMIAPALTPKRTHIGPNNPGLRLYKFNRDTGEVFDYTQFYMDLNEANYNNPFELEWRLEYNFTSYYGLDNINSESLHYLAERLMNTPLFQRYFKAKSARVLPRTKIDCSAGCVKKHFCAITRVDYGEFEECLKSIKTNQSSSSEFLKFSFITRLLIITFLLL
ncbi:hypothetical protein ABEB36_009208 [Hypothenemus hampei]|uniref:Sphingomyelin phosphodiesterase C-terminal domain-containing protein n=1 Tax=Hypothenemus hampei TaxID=57062 RepID=A0ABD1EPH9_HYPHA